MDDYELNSHSDILHGADLHWSAISYNTYRMDNIVLCWSLRKRYTGIIFSQSQRDVSEKPYNDQN